MRLTRRGKYSVGACLVVVAASIFCTTRYWSPDPVLQHNIKGIWVVIAFTLLVCTGYLLHDAYLAKNGTVLNAAVVKTIDLGLHGKSIRYEFHTPAGKLKKGLVDNAPVECVRQGQLPIMLDERTGWHTPVFLALVEKISS